MSSQDIPREVSLDEVLADKQRSARQIVDVDEPYTKLVIFRLQDSYYAFPGHAIREVVSNTMPVYPVPGMDSSVEGVMSLHGDIQSVLHLNTLLQLPAPDLRSRDRSILFGQGAGMQTGIRIDELLDVVDLPQSQLKLAPDSLPQHLRPFVSALLEFNGLPVTLLDLDLLLQSWQQSCT